MTTIGILTDFGPRGAHYVAEMKGVAYKINPDAHLVDISHNITPFSIREAAYTLFTVYDTFPPGTIFVTVVDPGVGSNRDIVAIQTADGYFLIGPDNGIFSYFAQQGLIAVTVKIEDEEYFYPPFAEIIKERRNRRDSIQDFETETRVPEMENIDFMNSPEKNTERETLWAGTFHGRDIMMPVAAHMAQGLELFSVGEIKDEICILDNLEPVISDDHRLLEGLIQYCDSFGNLISNIPISQFYSLFHQTAPFLHLHFHDKEYQIKVSRIFAGNPSESLLLVEGSSGFMEICLNQASAHEFLGASVGDHFTLEFMGGLFSEFSPKL
ncbi:MAG: SAM hydrolase/SAM-dependent halogenase family protein [Promethearchaeota archaeon]